MMATIARCCPLLEYDEFQNIKKPGRGAFSLFEMMRRERPTFRPWFIGLSGTPISVSPRDIAAVLSVIGDKTWEAEGNQFYIFRPKGISAFAKTVDRHFDDQSNSPDLKLKAMEAMNVFAK